jgi:Na+-driven multidrug efflux pump
LHSWLGSALHQRDLLKSRIRTTIALNVGVGFAAGLAFAVLGPPLARHMLARAEVPSVSENICIAAAVLLVTCISRGTGSVALVHLGQTRWITASAIIGAVSCMPALVVLASTYGSAGAFGAILLAEVIVLAVQLFALTKCANSSADSSNRGV